MVESFRPGVVDQLGIGYEALRAVNPGIVYCSTTGYGQDGPRAAWAGHDLDYLAVGGFLASTGPAADGGPPVSGRHGGRLRRRRDARGAGRDGRAPRPGRGRARARTSTCRSPTACCGSMSLAVDEHLATGADRRARARRPHRPLRLLRHVPLRRRPVAGGRGHRGEVLRQPVPRCSGCDAVDRPPVRRRRPGRHPGRPGRRLRPPRPRRVGGRAGRRRHLRGSPVQTVAELADDPQFRPGGALVEAKRPRAPDGGDRRRSARWGRCSPACPAGRRRCAAGDPTRSDTDGAAWRAAGMAPAQDRRAAAEGSGGMSAIGIADIEALSRRPPVRGGGGVPRRARLHLDELRLGRERQPALLGRRGRRRDHRRAHRPAVDDLGVVPSPPLGAGPVDARACPCRSTST